MYYLGLDRPISLRPGSNRQDYRPRFTVQMAQFRTGMRTELNRIIGLDLFGRKTLPIRRVVKWA